MSASSTLKTDSVRFKISLLLQIPLSPSQEKKYTAAFEMGNNRCMFRCEASVIGMDGVGEIPCISASTRFSSERFEIAMSGASFRGDLLDEYGVPLMRLYLSNNDGCMDRCVACWTKMNERTPRLMRRGFRVQRLRRLGPLKRWMSNENGLRRQSIL